MTIPTPYHRHTDDELLAAYRAYFPGPISPLVDEIVQRLERKTTWQREMAPLIAELESRGVDVTDAAQIQQFFAQHIAQE